MPLPPPAPLGLLFDKDGTLFRFGETWNIWAAEVIAHYAAGCDRTRQALADATGFDLTNSAFLPDSPVIAGTNREAAECLASALPGTDIGAIETYLADSAATAPLAPATDLPPFLEGLRARGMRLGVMTNDTERAALAQLGAVNITHKFDFIAGFDSGFGAKPAPDPLLAFARATDLDPARIAMIGDSTHDLIAGRAAGMITIGVLTGPALEPELSPHADVVLPDIGAIPEWLDQAFAPA
jgi:phosphoglycolate phosphatase